MTEPNQILEFHDPLPPKIEADSSSNPTILVTTGTFRPVDEELRALGYAVVWKPVQLEDGTIGNAFIGKKAEPRKPAKILIGRLPYGNSEVPDVADWLISSLQELQTDARVADFRIARIDDTPTSMCRNKLALVALEWGADALVFVDADMKPDYLLGNAEYPNAEPFLQTALDFWWDHPGPCLVAAPYMSGGGPQADEKCLIFRWASPRTPGEEGSYRLSNYSREEAAVMSGISRVSALPTGLLWVDCGAFRQMKKPWFYYEYTDDTYSEKASTEDITFTRDANLQSIPLYCAWDCWAGHWKRKLVGRPHVTSPVSIPPYFRNACLRHLHEPPRPNVTASV